MIKRTLLILLPLFFAAKCWCGGGGSDMDDLQGLIISNPKIPLYSKSRMQLIFFASRAERSGKLIKGTGAVLDIIRRGANPDDIFDGWGVKPYPLGTPLTPLMAFWKERVKFSEGLIMGDSCFIDTNSRKGSGSSPVFFRSPLLDLDGIGFEADFERRVVTVNSDVRVILRHGSSDLRKILAGTIPRPEKYEFIEATGDSLRIDMMKKEIMMIGNVVVTEDRGRLTCDRLTIYLDRKDKGDLMDGKDSLGGISRILAVGDVVVERKSDGSGKRPDRAEAEQLLCDVEADTVELSGDNSMPRIIASDGQIISGRTIKFDRSEMRAVINDDCTATAQNSSGKPVTMKADAGFFDIRNHINDLVGNVRLNDGRSVLTCRRMRILTKADGREKKKSSGSSGNSILGTEQFAAAGSGQQLDRIFFYDDVTVVDTRAVLRCDEMHANFADPARKGGRSFDLDTVDCFRNVKVVSAEKSAAGSSAELTSARARLNYPGNLLTFSEKVHMTSGTSVLDCDKLDMVLFDRNDGRRSGGAAADAATGSKGIRKAIATGRVKMHDPQADLSGEKLTLHFADADPAKARPGDIQSGGFRVSVAECEGNVVAVTTARPKAAKGSSGADPMSFFAGKSAGAVARRLEAQYVKMDLDRNVSEFLRDVKVSEGENLLCCQKMLLYSENIAPAASTPAGSVKAAPAEEDPDFDPYATLPAMEMVPSRILLGSGRELKRIVCEEKVLLRRTDPANGKVQQAGGDEAEYVVADQQAEIRRRKPNWAWLRMEGLRQECEKIICDFATGIFRTENVHSTVKE